MLWLNFLHFYQPANIPDYAIQEALGKSYWRLLRLMEEHNDLHMTWNISACLLERLDNAQEKDFLRRLKRIVQSGQVELSSSAAYHAFLPLLPDKEIIRQIKSSETILKKYFGYDFKAQGFFLPEMAYSSRVARLVKNLGYKWIIIDEIAYQTNLVSKSRLNTKLRPDWGRVYLDRTSSLKVIFRNREFSRAYPPDKLDLILSNEKKTDDVFISATDAELYGLRHKDQSAKLEKVVKAKNLTTMTMSQFINSNKQELIKMEPQASSWESEIKELKNKQPYKLWFDKKNKIQVELWKLANLVLSLEKKYPQDKNFSWYRWHLIRGLASCTFWWASAHDFSKMYGPYAWSPDDIERGLEDLIRAVRSLDDPQSKDDKLAAEKIYLYIKKLIWQEHWQKHWLKNYE